MLQSRLRLVLNLKVLLESLDDWEEECPISRAHHSGDHTSLSFTSTWYIPFVSEGRLKPSQSPLLFPGPPITGPTLLHSLILPPSLTLPLPGLLSAQVPSTDQPYLQRAPILDRRLLTGCPLCLLLVRRTVPSRPPHEIHPSTAMHVDRWWRSANTNLPHSSHS